jgi:hypothetical protein
VKVTANVGIRKGISETKGKKRRGIKGKLNENKRKGNRRNYTT